MIFLSYCGVITRKREVLLQFKHEGHTIVPYHLVLISAVIRLSFQNIEIYALMFHYIVQSTIENKTNKNEGIHFYIIITRSSSFGYSFSFVESNALTK